jgi:hypothetical protein
LGRKDELSSIADLRAAVARYRPLEAAFLEHPSDEQLKQMWGRAADDLIFGQLHLAARGVAKEAEDGSIVTDLGDGHELVVYPFVDQEPESQHHLHARAWLARRGASSKLDHLRDELWRALETGDPTPNDFFGTFGSRVLIGPRPSTGGTEIHEHDLLHQLRHAVLEYEDVQARIKSQPEDKSLKQADYEARFAIVGVFVRQYNDAHAIVREEPDGSHSCDLGDGREVVVKIVLNRKPAKKDRARAIAWLKSRGKKRLEDLPRELWHAVVADDPVDDLFRLERIEITVRRKT